MYTRDFEGKLAGEDVRVKGGVGEVGITGIAGC